MAPAWPARPRMLPVILPVVMLALPLSAQTGNRASMRLESRAIEMRGLEREPEREQKRQKAALEKRKQEFMLRLQEFALSWNDLVKACEAGIWNAKKAKKAHKAFDRLTQSDGWIEEAKR